MTTSEDNKLAVGIEHGDSYSARHGLIAAPESMSAFRQNLLALIVVLFLVLGLLVLSGVSVLTAALFTLTLAVQLAGGATIWLLVRGPSAVGTAELLGVGLAIGSILAVLFAQILMPFDLGVWAFLGAGLLPLCLWLIPSIRIRLLSLQSSTPSTPLFVSLLLLGLILSIFVLLPFLLTNPDKYSDYILYHLDFPYFEGLTHSVTTWGGSDSIHVAGTQIRYHWLTYAWAGWESKLSLAEPFVVLTRILPLAGVLGICLMTIAIAQAMSRKKSTAVVALMIVTLGTGVANPDFFGFLIVPGSPSQLLTTVWIMAAAFVLIRYVEGQAKSVGSLIVLSLLTFGCTGGKISAGAVLMGVGLAVAFISVFQRVHRIRALLALLVLGASTAIAYLMLMAPKTGSPTNYGNGLSLGPGLGVLFGLEPTEILASAPQTWWIIVSLAGFIVMNAKNSGIFFVRPLRSNAVAISAAAGAIFMGSFLSIVTVQSGTSHLYFILTAGAIAGPIAAVGITQYYFVQRQISHKLLFLSIAAATILSAFVFTGLRIDIPRRLKLDPLTYWSAFPFAVLVVIVLILLSLTWIIHRGASRKLLSSLTAFYMVTFLTSMSISTGVGFGIWSLPYASSYARESEYSGGYGWTSAHVEALSWLKDVSRPNDLIATNRFCRRGETPPNCDSLSFVVSALTGRRMLVEGYSYGVGLDLMPEWLSHRVNSSIDFVENPSIKLFNALDSYGVDWVVIDRAFPHALDWYPYAKVEYSNESVIVLKLN